MKLSGTFIVAWSSFALHVVLFPAILVASESHPHTGKVKPFKSGDPGVKINSKASAVLQQGKPYQTQIKDGSGKGGRGLVVQDVDAPTDVVWDRILDFDKYDKMVPKTYESQTYKSLSKGKMKEIWVRMKVGFPVYKITFYVHHWYEPSKNSMTWTLDYSKKSEIDDSCGYWYVVPHPDDPKHRTRVYYSVEVAMFPWVPKMLTDFMSKQALTDATAWVKKESEKKYAPFRPSAKVDSQPLPKSKSPWWKRFGKNKAVVIEEVEDESVQIAKKKIALARYALVSTVLVLLVYNFHLYFSQ